jgi:hypothetical protein
MSLSEIQTKLHAPKGQTNKFGGYKYRSCEDIVEAVKPLLAEYKYSLIVSDDIVFIADRVYVKATAYLFDESGNPVQKAVAFAREAESRKGMDESQITGTASSYARKYALNGLLAIDDTKDADTNEQAAQVSRPTKRIDREVKQNYVLQMREALDALDGLALRQLGDELKEDDDMMSAVWGEFNSKQKAAIKSLIHETKGK